MILFFLLGILALTFYKYFVKPLSIWKGKGIPYNKNAYPIAGNFLPSLLRKKSFVENIRDLYNEYPDKSFVGTFQFAQPGLLIRDLELIKQITVKNFDNFTDHRHLQDIDEPIFSKNLVQLQGQTWRDMRATLSPAFTGSKMKAMFGLISDCAIQISEHFQKKHENIIQLEMKDLFTRYANDVIATCAFGVRCDSINQPTNDFYLMGKSATDFSGFKSLKFFTLSSFPKLNKLLKIKIFPKEIVDFFTKTIKDTIKYRIDNNVIRPDMIHLLLEARKGKLKYEETQEDTIDKGFAVVEESSIGKQEITAPKEITDADIISQAFVFFFAGFDTSSTLLCFASYELALNPDIQELLLQEIKDTMERCDNKLTYEAVMSMTYLDMVISETLRKWPASPMTDRECTKNFTLKTANQDDYLVEKGDIVFLPTMCLHRDEKYFPNPDKFDPERFSEENKHNIIPYSYIPFGVGPRACIGSRFALMQTKVILVHLLNNFELVAIDKTVIPMVLSKKNIMMQPDGGFWLGLQQRTH